MKSVFYAAIYLIVTIGYFCVGGIVGCSSSGFSDPMTAQPKVVIMSPNQDTTWYAGQTVTVIWETQSLIPIDSYRIYLSCDGSKFDEMEGGILMESDKISTFHWGLPNDSNERERIFGQVKVEGWQDSRLIVVDVSETFLMKSIDDVPEPPQVFSDLEISISTIHVEVGEPFSIRAIAFDQTGNVINDFSGEITVADSSGSIFPNSLGDGNYGTWSNGRVLYNSFTVGTPGMHTITCACNGLVNEKNIFVPESSQPELVNVALIPDWDMTVLMGDVIQYTAVAIDNYGGIIATNPFEFTWFNADVGGIFHADAPGVFEISVQYNGMTSNNSIVTVMSTDE